MKKNSAIDYYLLLIAKAVSAIIRFIPIGFSIFIIRAIGALAFYFLRKKRRTAYKNLKIAFPYYPCRKINKIVKQVFMGCAQHFIELFYLPWMDERYIKRFIEIEGIDTVFDIMENKKGGIFLGLHEGSWEVGNIAVAQVFKKYNYTVLSRAQANIPLLSELLNEFRAKRHINIVRITDSFRPLIECLKNGSALCMIADHGAQGGIFVDFFNRPALTPTGALKLALKLDTNLVIGFIKNRRGAYHKVTLTPYKLVRTGDVDRDLKVNLENINRKFEGYIKDNPEEYLWFFKRWKYSPQRNILVISDGKPGHLKQSLAILDLIKSLPFQVKSEVVEIRFRNIWQRIAFQICGFFFSRNCQGCMGCLRRLFNLAEYRKLLFNYYDAVISCGSSLAMLNRLVAFENMAKSIVIMKPGMFSLKRFDLAIIPEHDNAPKFNNVVLTKGALSRRADKNKEHIEAIIDGFGLKNPSVVRPVIGVLLGGDNRYLSLCVKTVEEMINSLSDVVESLGGSLLVSTSRRTSKDIEQLLKEKLSKKPRCRMLIIANECNPQGSLDAILYLSDILVVSGDSISMICEAINSGKHTAVFKLKRKTFSLLSKHEDFIENLEKDGYISIVSKENLSKKLTYIWKHNSVIKQIDDHAVILDRLRKIL